MVITYSSFVSSDERYWSPLSVYYINKHLKQPRKEKKKKSLVHMVHTNNCALNFKSATWTQEGTAKRLDSLPVLASGSVTIAFKGCIEGKFWEEKHLFLLDQLTMINIDKDLAPYIRQAMNTQTSSEKLHRQRRIEALIKAMRFHRREHDDFQKV